MSVTDWVKNAVFYQIFPDRFANGNHRNDPENVRPWGSIPTNNGYMGGDFDGIIQHMDYLRDLGINALYLNPVFLSSTTHRYNATDYFKIDPFLGDEQDFLRLVKTVHENGMKIILDGVFNHCGRGFFAFTDILENQDHSPYRNWFHIKKFPINAYGGGDAVDYLGWWNHKSLPKFNTSNPDTRRYLMGVVRYWTEKGIDGWRLDVPNEIDDDEFWAEFRNIVREINPEAYTLGEIWDIQPRWVGDAHFDGLMHYPVRSAILDLLNHRLDVKTYQARIHQFLHAYPKENTDSMYLLLGSHDTERILTMLGKSVEKVKAAYLLLFSLPGAPGIYYGDEVGLEGGKDPDCRRAFPWDKSQWNSDLREFVKKIISVRMSSQALKAGDFILPDHFQTDGLFACWRTLPSEKILCLVNPGSSRWDGRISVSEFPNPERGAIKDMITGTDYSVLEGQVHVGLEPYSGVFLK